MAGHGHHHHHSVDAGDRSVLWAVVVNVGLTVAQLVGGLVAGSLALVADAVHNLSDAISLGIAFAARKIARRPSDDRMTFGYVRAEIVAALINYTTPIVIGLFLAYEAVVRFFDPPEVAGWIVVWIAGIALVIDVITALLTYRLSKSSMNIRAAFLHNVADALGSVAVIIAGTLIILYDWRIVDPIITLLISVYILWHAFAEIGGAIRILMLGTPPDVDVDSLMTALRQVDGVEDVHHLHVWSIDEHRASLEAHVVTAATGQDVEPIKQRMRAVAREQFGIAHCTLEMEYGSACCDGDHAQPVGHHVGQPPQSHSHTH